MGEGWGSSVVESPTEVILRCGRWWIFDDRNRLSGSRALVLW